MTDHLPKAILLDLDDTILANGSPDDSWQATLNIFTSRMKGITTQELLASIREYRDWFWSDPKRHRRGRLNLDVARRGIVGGALARLGISDLELAKEIGEAYSIQQDQSLKPFPGAIDTLRRLRELDVPLALITNGSSEAQRHKIERFELAPYFDCIIIEGEFGFGKPDKQVFLHALDQLKVTPSEAWMVGDNLEQDVGDLREWASSVSGMTGPVQGCLSPAVYAPNRIIRTLPELLD